ncbi:MotA/TolQ/ExbB proton channel [Nitrospira sp. KM1]|uniref:MotA/TolQ/ExbB proton channel family protein n=1 Tax=Nitrospira sp. KM1 TaxID=1936990 RepID=UPI0013A76B34|nr:MotA/TolQ/ExbB proton channel family protein [Nitrospira sp. KM1]BCA57087.1 MotA/TolQ/ExbB proton channel [Nitrospira sp. KM1]
MDGSMAGGVAFALSHATLEGKITIAVLLVFSLASWSVIVSKLLQLAKARRRNRTFLDAYSKTRGPLVVFSKGPITKLQGSPMYELYYGGCEELTVQQEKYKDKRIPRHGINAVRIALERVLGECVVSLESGMIVLATAISGGPFVGLLGTVWGVMDTFSGIGRAHQASLTTMAPGVASALIATVAGLMVAIPSLFFYNYLVTKIKTLVMELENFGAHLESVFTAEFQIERNGKDEPDDDIEGFGGPGRDGEDLTMDTASTH